MEETKEGFFHEDIRNDSFEKFVMPISIDCDDIILSSRLTDREREFVDYSAYNRAFGYTGDISEHVLMNPMVFQENRDLGQHVLCDAEIQEDARHEKPKCSYADLIKSALASSAEGKLTLSEIYAWIKQNYPFFRKGSPVWQNSIRHNLSLNKSFKKICREPNSVGKGGYWAIDETFVPRKLVRTKKAQEKKADPVTKPETIDHEQCQKNNDSICIGDCTYDNMAFEKFSVEKSDSSLVYKYKHKLAVK